MLGLKKIISGGQTGVDRAALDAALDMNFECGGWCPEGRLAEDGVIPDKYPLVVLPGGGYEERTLKNLIDSDGTLVIYFGAPSGGTLETLEWCNERQKPIETINANKVSIEDAVVKLGWFLSVSAIQALNVAGPRASKQPRAYKYCYELVKQLIKNTRPDRGSS